MSQDLFKLQTSEDGDLVLQPSQAVAYDKFVSQLVVVPDTLDNKGDLDVFLPASTVGPQPNVIPSTPLSDGSSSSAVVCGESVSDTDPVVEGHIIMDITPIWHESQAQHLTVPDTSAVSQPDKEMHFCHASRTQSQETIDSFSLSIPKDDGAGCLNTSNISCSNLISNGGLSVDHQLMTASMHPIGVSTPFSKGMQITTHPVEMDADLSVEVASPAAGRFVVAPLLNGVTGRPDCRSTPVAGRCQVSAVVSCSGEAVGDAHHEPFLVGVGGSKAAKSSARLCPLCGFQFPRWKLKLLSADWSAQAIDHFLIPRKSRVLPGWRRKYFVKRRRNWKHNSAVDSSSISQEDLHGREKLNTPNQTTMDKTTSLPTSTSFPGIVSCHPGMNGIYQSITMPDANEGRRTSPIPSSSLPDLRPSNELFSRYDSHNQAMNDGASLSSKPSYDTVVERVVTESVQRLIRRTTRVRHINKDNVVVFDRTTQEEVPLQTIEETTNITRRYLSSPPLPPSPSIHSLTSGSMADLSSWSAPRVSCSTSGQDVFATASPTLCTATCSLAAEVGETPSLPGAIIYDLSSIEKESGHLDVGDVSCLFGGPSPRNKTADRLTHAQTTQRSPVGVAPVDRPRGRNTLPARVDGCPLWQARRVPVSGHIVGDVSKSAGDYECALTEVSGMTGADMLQFKAMSAVSDARLSSTEQNWVRCSSADSSVVEVFRQTPKGRPLSTTDKAMSVFREHKNVSSSKEIDVRISSISAVGMSEHSVPGDDIESISVNNCGDMSHFSQQLQQASLQKSSSTYTVGKLTVGAKIFSKYSDDCFYPSVFLGLNTGIGNSFRVRFLDGVLKTLRAIDLVQVDRFPIGQCVMVHGEDGLYDRGMIAKKIIECSESLQEDVAIYKVDLYNGSSRMCRHEDIILTNDQVALLRSDGVIQADVSGNANSVNTADVLQDNIIEGSRLRNRNLLSGGSLWVSSPSMSFDDEVADEGSPSLFSFTKCIRKKKKQVQQKMITTATEQSLHYSNASRPVISRKAEFSTGRVIKCGRRRKMPIAATSTPTLEPVTVRSLDIAQKDEVPLATNPQLFNGIVFILTRGYKSIYEVHQEKILLRGSLPGSSTEDQYEESEGHLPHTVPYDKDALVAQMLSGGANLMPNFTTPRVDKGLQLLGVSDAHCSTRKYLMCLAANIPVVSHMWLYASCKQNKLMDYAAYMLPAGVSLERHQLMERVKDLSCLRGKHIFVDSMNDKFKDIWCRVLTFAGCRVFQALPPVTRKGCPAIDVAVVDDLCPSNAAVRLKSMHVPMVTACWLVQCLINNQIMVFDGHPDYVCRV